MRINKEPWKLKIGDLVTTDYPWGKESKVIRKIVSITPGGMCESGLWVIVDPPCNIKQGHPAMDAGWFIPVDWLQWEELEMQ